MLVSYGFDLRNVQIINSTEYKFWNIFFCFCLNLFAFNLAINSLISYLEQHIIIVTLAPELRRRCKYYGSFETRPQKKSK